MTGLRQFALAFVLIAAFSTAAIAQDRVVPAVTIAGFSIDKTGISDKDAEALAELLAVQLVESGRYRVMDRSLLPIAGNPTRPSLSTIRRAAKEAGLDYVVVGRVAKVSERLRAPAPIAFNQFRGPGPYRAPNGYGIPFPRRGSLKRDYLRLSIELIDAHSGRVLTESRATCDSQVRGPRVPLIAAPTSPVAMVVGLIAAKRAASVSVSPELERALTRMATELIRWNPQGL